VAFPIIAYLARKLVDNFEPENPRNTWRNAFLTALLMLALREVSNLVSDDLGIAALAIGLAANAIPFWVIYRVSFGLGIGIGCLLSILLFAIAFGAVLGFAFLFSIHPAVAAAGVLLAVGIPVLLYVRDRRFRKRMESVD
jgi:MFS family permease